ncbi:TPA: hypothetical protein RUZ56_003290 [Vibrio cholerae]|nr:hypothetical protein [Vibrio cholerae]HDZ9341947.1 hypothetical protein [Vibrio cholerae]
MNRKETMHKLIEVLAFELMQEIKEREVQSNDRWVAVADINNDLELKFVAVPKSGTQYGEKGWLFAILARMLEDRSLVEFKKSATTHTIEHAHNKRLKGTANA